MMGFPFLKTRVVTPPLLLFIGPGTGEEWMQTPREWCLGPIGKHHVEGQDEPSQGRFGRPVGSADPLWAHLSLCFRVVAVLWVLSAVPGVHLVLRRFACPWALQSM